MALEKYMQEIPYGARTVYNRKKENKVQVYGKKSYTEKLIDLFKSSKSGTQDYWVEIK